MDTLDNLGMSSAEEAEVHQQWNTYTKVINQLMQEGLQTLPPPQIAYPTYLDIDTLTSHNSSTLTIELARNKAWKDYLAQRLTYTDMILTQTKNEVADIEAECKKRLRATATSRSKAPTKEEILDKAKTDPRYRQLKVQQQEHEQLKIAYEADKERFSGNYALISRCITLRGQDIEEGNRQGNVGAHGAGAPPYF